MFLLLVLLASNLYAKSFIGIGYKPHCEFFKIENGRFENKIGKVRGNMQLIGGDAGKELLKNEFFSQKKFLLGNALSISFSTSTSHRISLIKSLAFNINLKKNSKIIDYNNGSGLNIKIDYQHSSSISGGLFALLKLNHKTGIYFGGEVHAHYPEQIVVNIKTDNYRDRMVHYKTNYLKIMPCIGTQVQLNSKIGIDLGVRYFRNFIKTKSEDEEIPLDFKVKYSSIYLSSTLSFRIKSD